MAAYEAGLGSAEWPARLQRLQTGALTVLAPPGSDLWLDGGHNAGAGRAIAAALADLEERLSRPLILIVGMLETKDVEGFLRNFAGLARRVIGVPIPGQEKGRSPDAIADAARRVGIAADARASVADALARIAQLGLDPPPRVLITGSLYLAGDVLAANGAALG
jgi:dihydrofolate synthase/folylpolyglutamate synthase